LFIGHVSFAPFLYAMALADRESAILVLLVLDGGPHALDKTARL